MRITESKLRDVIRSIIRESVQDDFAHRCYLDLEQIGLLSDTQDSDIMGLLTIVSDFLYLRERMMKHPDLVSNQNLKSYIEKATSPSGQWTRDVKYSVNNRG